MPGKGKVRGSTKKLTIGDCIKVAESRGGKCLSSEYINSKAKMEWECSEGHRWLAQFYNIKNKDSWCPECYRNTGLTIEDARIVALKRDGKCLSSTYINNKCGLEWGCSEGHIWFANLNNVKNSNSWCPHCAGNEKCVRGTIDDAIAIAHERGGRCISTEYTNNRIKLEWECSNGHRWWAKFGNIKANNTWCPKCPRSNALTIDDAHNAAFKHNGMCLSTVYENIEKKLHWRCQKGHEWLASLNMVRNSNSWCPECSNGKTQRLLTDIIKNIFPNYVVRSNYKGFGWLLTKNGRRQEIDIYIQDLKLAIEYDGKQHFMPVCFGGISYDRAERNYKITKRLDKLKNKKIRRHKEDVNYFIRLNYKEIITEKYVREKLIEIGVDL